MATDDGGLERGRLEVGSEWLRCLADRLDIGQLQVGDALLETFHQPINPPTSVLIGAL